MQLTIITGDNVACLEVADDMELENFLALCKLELATISDIPANQLLLRFDGQQLVPNSAALLKKELKDLHFKNGEAIHIAIMPSTPTAHPVQSSSRQLASSSGRSAVVRTHQQGQGGDGGGIVSSLISNLVQGIKVPKRPAADAQDRAMAENIFAACGEPHRLDFLKAEYPELAAAYEANPNDKESFVAAFHRFKEEMARRSKVMQDETSEEGQRYIAQMIERQNIEFMHQFAMEHMPEAFVPVQMLYIRMKINGHPVIAFVDSGAQTSILSESCAKRCDVLRFVDRRIRVQAVGIGGSQKMLGRIHSCQVQVNDHIFPCPFEVMSDRDIDILFGLNTLLRHKCCIDLQRMCLRFGDGTEAKFLSEAEFQQEKEGILQDETTTNEEEKQMDSK